MMSAGMRESEFLSQIRLATRPDPRVPIHIGDDLAALQFESTDLVLVGIDQVLDRVHFDLRQHTLEQVARKAVLRNISDCAAMACVPVACVASLALPASSPPLDPRVIFDAMTQVASQFDCVIVGGDTGSWAGPLAISVAIIGGSRGVTPVRRSGAKPGDKLFVTGPLGGSILGRHLNFTPRITLARELARHFDIHAMLDLSDGLSQDLPRICDMSGVGATIDAAAVPIHDDVSKLNSARSPLDHALHDGEDYELLFAAPSCDDPRVTCIGTVDQHLGVRITIDGITVPLLPRGWDHAF